MGRSWPENRLVAGRYEPIELTTAPDGLLKGYSEILGLSLCWDDNWPRLYDPATDTYLETWRQEQAARQAERAAREAAEAQVAIEQAGRLAEQAARRAAEAELQQLRAQLRRRP